MSFGEDSFVGVGEFTEVFLAEPTITHGLAFAFEVFGADAGALGGGDFDAMPTGTSRGPSLKEEATAAEGRAHEPEITVTCGKDGAHGEVEVFRHASGLIDEQKAGAGEAANVGLRTWKSDDARAVW